VNFPAYPGVYHWTSTTYGRETRFALIYCLWYGLMDTQGKDSPFATLYVLPVRGAHMGAATSAGRVPQDALLPGTPLTVNKAAEDRLALSWGASCVPADTDYEIYEGAIGSFAGHAPRACTTGGATTWTITPAEGNRFFLVVPTNGSVEGSYGLTSAGAERPAGASVCRPQAIAVCPAG